MCLFAGGFFYQFFANYLLKKNAQMPGRLNQSTGPHSGVGNMED